MLSVTERDAVHRIRARARLLTELHATRAALESARNKSNNPVLTFKLAGQVAALERRLEIVRKGDADDQTY